LGVRRLALVTLVLPAVLAACAHAPAPAVSEAACVGSGERATAELVFARVAGQTLGPGVSEAAFSQFVSDQIAPRFHDGLTVLDAQDLTPRPAGETVYGPAKVVMIVLPGRPDDDAQIAAIRNAYSRRFKQQSVIAQSRQACVSF
jgi:hypothetical protein